MMRRPIAMLAATIALLGSSIVSAQKIQPLAPGKTSALSGNSLKEVSAVCKIGDALFLAGDDDQYPIWMVRGETVKSFTLANPVFSDIEAMAPISATDILIVSSQALSEDGTYKNKRTRIGLMSFPNGIDGEATVTAYEGFRDDVISYLGEHQDAFMDFTALSTKAPREGGLSIEGAAYDQKNGILFLGTRDGRSRTGGAVIFSVTNIKNVMAQKEKPKFGELTKLPLSSFAVRDMIFSNDRVLILFGAMHGVQRPNASIASWNPVLPKTIDVMELAGIDSLKRAEALYVDSASKEYVVIEDLDDNNVGTNLESISHRYSMVGVKTTTMPTPAPPKTAAPAGMPAATTGTEKTAETKPTGTKAP